MIILIAIGVLCLWGFISWISDLVKRANFYDQLKPRLDSVESRENQLKHDQETWESKVTNDKMQLEGIAKEKSKGFPWLAKAYADYYHLLDLKKATWLETKAHPAQKAADTVREISYAKRETEKLWRILKYQIEYYETLFPWLVDFKDDDIDDIVRQAAENKYSDDIPYVI